MPSSKARRFGETPDLRDPGPIKSESNRSRRPLRARRCRIRGAQIHLPASQHKRALRSALETGLIFATVCAMKVAWRACHSDSISVAPRCMDLASCGQTAMRVSGSHQKAAVPPESGKGNRHCCNSGEKGNIEPPVRASTAKARKSSSSAPRLLLASLFALCANPRRLCHSWLWLDMSSSCSAFRWAFGSQLRQARLLFWRRRRSSHARGSWRDRRRFGAPW